MERAVFERTSFVVACAIAGALAPPLDAVATPVSTVVAGILGLFGLRVWRWSGLPQRVPGGDRRGLWWIVRPGVWFGLGLAVGLVLLGVIRVVLEPALPSMGARMAAAGTLPVWRRLLIIYVAAVGEEVLFRLLLLSVIAGLMVRLFRLPGRTPTAPIAWVANGLSALAFAAVHLPAWSGAPPVGVGSTVAVLALNSAGGIVLGYVFANRGIVAAMWTHAGADCVIQLLGPLTG